MNEPIIRTSEIAQDDGGLDKVIAKSNELLIVLQEIERRAKMLRSENAGLGIASSDDQANIQRASQEAKKLAKVQADVRASYAETTKEIERLKLERRDNLKVTRLKIKLDQAEQGSQEALKAQYQLNLIALSKLSKEQIKSSKAAQKMVKETKELKEEIDDFKESVGTRPLGRLLENLEAVPGATSDAIGGVRGLGQSFKALIANPIVLTISLLVSGFTALFNAFKQSEKGANLFARASGVVSGVMSGLVKLSNVVFDALSSAFNNPKEAVLSLWETIKTNIVNRFLALPKLFKSSGSLIGNTFKLIGQQAKLAFAKVPILGDGIDKEQVQKNIKDLKEEIRSGFSDFASAGIQLGTGLDKEQQKEVAEGFKGVVDGITENAKKFGDLEVAQRNYTRQAARLRVEIAELNKQQQLQAQIAGDATRSFEEQRKANEESSRLAVERGQKELALSKLSLGLINRELSIRRANGQDTVELLDKQAAAIEDLKNTELDYLSTVEDASIERRQIRQDELERDLDFLIDLTEARVNANASRLNNERLSFESRRNILEENQNLLNDAFRKEIAIIEELAGRTVNANDFINESNISVVIERARALGLSEVIEGRLIEIIKERIAANKDLSDSERDLIEQEEKLNQELVKTKIEALNKERDLKLKAFEDDQELAQSEFDLLKKTEKEKADFEIQQEIEKLQKLLELNKEYQEALKNDGTLSGAEGVEVLSDTEVKTIQNKIKKAQQDIKAEGEKEPFSVIKAIFPSSTEEDQALLNNLTGQALDSIKKMADAKVQASQRAVDAAKRETDAARSALSAEIELARSGQNARVEAARAELKEAQANEKKRLAEQKKALKNKQRLERLEIASQSIVQGQNLITAASKVWSNFGFPAAIPIIATMFGLFATQKIAAFRATRRNFSKGGYDVLGGGSHGSGRDTFIGVGSGGTHDYGQSNEGRAIYNRAATKAYKNRLPGLTNAINNLELDKWIDDYLGKDHSNVFVPSVGIPVSEELRRAIDGVTFRSNSNFDSSTMERYLSSIDRKVGYQDSRGPDGKGVVINKNMVTNYV